MKFCFCQRIRVRQGGGVALISFEYVNVAPVAHFP